jgi:hypothetical protein
MSSGLNCGHLAGEVLSELGELLPDPVVRSKVERRCGRRCAAAPESSAMVSSRG